MRCLRYLGLLFALLTVPAARAEGVYFTSEAVLKAFFRDSDKVGYIELRTAEHAERLQQALGYVPKKPKYVVFVARRGEHIDGYAVLDEERGQHLPIGFATKLTPAGAVERTEIMAYREAYGEEIRAERFRRQFVGKDASQPMAPGSDIVAISGATISSRSMAIAVKRATVLVDIARHVPENASQPHGAKPKEMTH